MEFKSRSYWIKIYLRTFFLCLVLHLCFRVTRQRFHHIMGFGTGDVINLHECCKDATITLMSSFDREWELSKNLGNENHITGGNALDNIWDLISNDQVFSTRTEIPLGLNASDAVMKKDISSIRRLVSKSETKFRYSSLQASSLKSKFVYRRLDRIRGVQYLAVTEPDADKSNRTSAYLIEQKFGSKVCHVSKRVLSTEHAPVYIILPFTTRDKFLKRFLEQIIKLRREQNYDLHVIVSILKSSNDKESFERVMNEINREYNSTAQNFVILSENYGDSSGLFSKGVAIREAARLVPDDNSIIFLCDLEMIVREDFVRRCQSNTICGTQVYFPVVYSLYSYGNKKPVISAQNGIWRTTGYGMACMCKIDFFRVDAFQDADTRFHHWGLEDVYQYERFIGDKQVVIFRAVEPGLIHMWHPKYCNRNSVHYNSCLATQLMLLAHPSKLDKLLSQKTTLNKIIGP